MLGEKRNLSLFGSQPAQEEKQVKHITVDRDGEKKDIPLYFGPDWPVVNGTGDTVPSPSDDPSACQAEATAEKTEETVPVEPIPQDTPAGIADNSPDSDVRYPDDSPRRILASTTVVANRTHALFFAPEGDSRDFNSVLKEVQEYISGKYSSLITDGGDEDAKSQIKRYITKYVQDQRIAVKGYSADGLVDALYTEMAEFGLLTKYIFGTGIEEININSWRDIEVLYSNGQMVKLDEHFDSPGHAINVIRRMLHVSGMVLDNASPAVLGHLSKNIRIAVLKTPLVDEDVGVTASIRIVNPQNMQKDDFVRGGTATGDMLDFLSACLRYGVSVCVAGATGSGKTTVAGWLLTTIPDNKRVFTIENGSRELDLVREKDGKVCNSVIHTITRESENAKQNIDQDMLLDMALRYHPDIICVGEMRSAEAYAAQEAARTGHGVLTTIHSNSSQATWRRMVTLCKRKHEMSDDIVLPEEDQTKYFMVSLILQNLYREILTVADENGGRLKNRVVFFADELGTCPPIQSLELMFSASRSRGLMLVPIVQSITGQLKKNYGAEGAEVIVDNCQVNLYGGFAPASQTAVELSKALGSRTVMSGSISRGKNDPSQSLQMIERPLMTPDELKSMPKGSFIVAKTGVHPMKVKLRLFLDWGIRFGEPYEVPEKAQRAVAYADKQELEESIIRRHYGTVAEEEPPQDVPAAVGGMNHGMQAEKNSRKTILRP